MTRLVTASGQPDRMARQESATLPDGSPRQEQVATGTMTEIFPTSLAPTLTLRVTESRVEDVGHAIARVTPADLRRMAAHAGDVLKITGGTMGVARAELSDDACEGMIRIDGTCRSNCSAGLQEQVTVTPIEREQAVAVRLSPDGSGNGDHCFFAWGEIFSLFPSITGDLFGKTWATTNYGIVYTAKGMGALFAGVGAAWVV